MLVLFFASVIAVPTVDAKGKHWLFSLLSQYLGLKSLYNEIKDIIALITKDIEEMERMKKDAEDELLNDLYPRREDAEKALQEVQDKLDELNAEIDAAKTKRSDANSRISTLEKEISQTKFSLSMLSPSEHSEHARLLTQLSMQESSLSSAKQDVKDANKIINSPLRSLQISHYESAIGNASTGLTGRVVSIKSRIYTLETLVDNLKRDIENKKTEKENQEKREDRVSKDVEEARKKYEDGKKNGNPNTEK